MNDTTLKQRLTSFLGVLGVPVTRFSSMVGLSPSTVHKWRSGLLRLSESALQRIDILLSQYGF